MKLKSISICLSLSMLFLAAMPGALASDPSVVTVAEQEQQGTEASPEAVALEVPSEPPTDSPSPTVSAEPTQTTEAEPSPEASEVPTVSEEPSPAAEAEPSPEAQAEPAPASEEAPSPTVEETPSASPEASQEPVVEDPMAPSAVAVPAIGSAAATNIAAVSDASTQSGGATAAQLYVGTKTFDDFYPRATVNGEVERPGIDVSVWNGKIDWQAVADSGVEFAFIRCAYMGTATGVLAKDSRYKENIEGALAAGIKVGAYIYSQAINVTEARQEAQYLMSLVSGYNIEMPLVIDYEYYTNNTGRLYDANLSRSEATAVCNAFCDEVENAGYSSAVYSGYYLLRDDLYASQLGTVWLANYRSWTDYSGDYEYWQCTSSGLVPGIDVATDLNFWFDPGGSSTSGLPFSDVKVGQWYYQNIKTAYQLGIINGVTAKSFRPNGTATRGQVVTMLYRLEGSPAVSGSASFTDLLNDYYKKPIAWAEQNGVVQGVGGGSFAPEDAITRESLATILYRLKGSPSTSQSLSAFTDASSVSTYAKKAVQWAVQSGILKGADGTLSPQGEATRAEVCTMLMRFHAL